MVYVFLVLQFSSLLGQLYFGIKGFKQGDMTEPGYGYAIWGGFITILLGLPVQLELVS